MISKMLIFSLMLNSLKIEDCGFFNNVTRWSKKEETLRAQPQRFNFRLVTDNCVPA